MSVQETAFKAIADAIREKDGSTDLIRALGFAERIRAIQVDTGEDEVDYHISMLDKYDNTLTTYLGILHCLDFTTIVECPTDVEILEGEI